MNLLALSQSSPEWLAARVGRCTGSRVKDALSVLKNGAPSAKRDSYLIDVVTERLVGFAAEHYVNPSMEWGIENEKKARAAYEIRTGNLVKRVGIVAHATIEDFMVSPDGFVGDDGLAEFKCPNSTAHVRWMLEDKVPDEHRYQLLAQLSCSNRKFVDFASWDGRLGPRYELFIKRLERTDAVEEEIAAMEKGVKLFLGDVQLCIEKLQEMNPELFEHSRAETAVNLTGDFEQDWRTIADELAGQIQQ